MTCPRSSDSRPIPATQRCAGPQHVLGKRRSARADGEPGFDAGPAPITCPCRRAGRVGPGQGDRCQLLVTQPKHIARDPELLDCMGDECDEPERNLKQQRCKERRLVQAAPWERFDVQSAQSPPGRRSREAAERRTTSLRRQRASGRGPPRRSARGRPPPRPRRGSRARAARGLQGRASSRRPRRLARLNPRTRDIRGCARGPTRTAISAMAAADGGSRRHRGTSRVGRAIRSG
jgi:hypothetical protein